MDASSDGGEAPEEASVVETSHFLSYLRRVVPPLFEGESEVPLELDAALKESVHLEYINKYLSDNQIRSLLVTKTPLKDEEEGDESAATETGSDNGRAVYSINLDVHYEGPKLASIAFIKRGAIVEADKKIALQIRVFNLNEGSPYETLHSYISNAVSPYFKSFVRRSGKADR
jgi:dynein heavy chain 1